MSGAECRKTMLCGQAVVFSASSPARLSALLTHWALALLFCKNAKKITPVVQATNWLKTGPEGRFGQKAEFFPTKIGRKKS